MLFQFVSGNDEGSINTVAPIPVPRAQLFAHTNHPASGCGAVAGAVQSTLPSARRGRVGIFPYTSPSDAGCTRSHFNNVPPGCVNGPADESVCNSIFTYASLARSAFCKRWICPWIVCSNNFPDAVPATVSRSQATRSPNPPVPLPTVRGPIVFPPPVPSVTLHPATVFGTVRPPSCGHGLPDAPAGVGVGVGTGVTAGEGNGLWFPVFLVVLPGFPPGAFVTGSPTWIVCVRVFPLERCCVSVCPHIAAATTHAITCNTLIRPD